MYLSPESLLVIAILVLAVIFFGRFLRWVLALLLAGLVGLLLLAAYSDLTTGTHAVIGLLNLFYGAIFSLAVVVAAYLKGLGQKPTPAPEKKYKS